MGSIPIPRTFFFFFFFFELSSYAPLVTLLCSKARFTELNKKTATGTPKTKARVRIPNKEQEYEYDEEDLENLVDDEDYYDSDYGMSSFLSSLQNKKRKKKTGGGKTKLLTLY